MKIHLTKSNIVLIACYYKYINQHQKDVQFCMKTDFFYSMIYSIFSSYFSFNFTLNFRGKWGFMTVKFMSCVNFVHLVDALLKTYLKSSSRWN